MTTLTIVAFILTTVALAAARITLRHEPVTQQQRDLIDELSGSPKAHTVYRVKGNRIYRRYAATAIYQDSKGIAFLKGFGTSEFAAAHNLIGTLADLRISDMRGDLKRTKKLMEQRRNRIIGQAKAKP